MGRKKILWLASWYPSIDDPFDGDFIQRHARAAAIHHDIFVIHIVSTAINPLPETTVHRSTGLTEKSIYLNRSNSLFTKYFYWRRWQNEMKRVIREYVTQSGCPDIVHIHVPWKAGLMAGWIKKTYNVQVFTTEHWGLYEAGIPGNIYQKPPAVRALLKRSIVGADRIFAVSRFLKEGIEHFSRRRVDGIIPNVVDTSLFFPRTAKYNVFTFLHVSNLAPVKNPRAILQAFERLLQDGQDAQLVIIGNRDNDAHKFIEDRSLLNARIFFRGEVSYREVAEEMGRSHAFLIFSFSETFSCVTAEALCSGLPVIAADAGALPELVDSDNGIKVEPGNVDELTAAMFRMMRDHSLYKPDEIAVAARNRFDYARIATCFDEVYKEDKA